MTMAELISFKLYNPFAYIIRLLSSQQSSGFVAFSTGKRHYVFFLMTGNLRQFQILYHYQPYAKKTYIKAYAKSKTSWPTMLKHHCLLSQAPRIDDTNKEFSSELRRCGSWLDSGLMAL